VSVAHWAFSASQNGTLVYRSGTLAGNRELALLDRTGKRLNSVGKPGLIREAALSLDEKHVAFELADPQTGGSDLWLLDLARGATSRFTFSPAPIFTGNPVWSPDGARIVYQSRHTVLRDLYQKAANGAGKEELLTHATGYNAYPNDWSPDGKFIVYVQTSQPTKRDLWLLPTEGDHKPVPYLQTPANEDFGQFSPDGRWMAYASDESGQNQIYVQSIPTGGAKWQISTAGGSEPRWRRDGKELFYIASDQKLMAVPMKVSAAGVEAGTPQALFEDVPAGAPERFTYQPTADGQRFLFLAPANTEAPAPITVLLNWQSRAKK
jgi:Tol biopolymer transport system component